MNEPDDFPAPDQMVKQGDTYNHAEYGPVEVNGIWKGVNQIDTAGNIAESGMIIVRYSIEQENEHVTELTDTLNEFLKAIE